MIPNIAIPESNSQQSNTTTTPATVKPAKKLSQIIGSIAVILLIIIAATFGFLIGTNSSPDLSANKNNDQPVAQVTTTPVITVVTEAPTLTPTASPTPVPYEIKIDSLDCKYLSTAEAHEYYLLIASGVMSGPVNTIGVANSMQINLSAQKKKNISLDCGSWSFAIANNNYTCTRRETDPATTTYSYREENLVFEKCPGSGCADVNQNTYFFNAYVYDPAGVTGKKHFRPEPFVGKQLDYQAFTCGGRTGYGLRFVD